MSSGASKQCAVAVARVPMGARAHCFVAPPILLGARSGGLARTATAPPGSLLSHELRRAPPFPGAALAEDWRAISPACGMRVLVVWCGVVWCGVV